MRFIVGCLILCCAVTASADDKSLRFGGQISGNSYRVDDPAGPTANGSGVSFGALAIYELNRSGRLMLGVSRGSYQLEGTTENVGQQVTTTGGSLSYQKQWRVTRDFKPWLGFGLGYSSSTYKNRFTFVSAGSQYKTLYADRTATDFSYLLNANSEWDLDQDWSLGLQAQFDKSFSDKTNTMRVGVYLLY